MTIRVTPMMFLGFVWRFIWLGIFAVLMTLTVIPLTMVGETRLLGSITKALREDRKRQETKLQEEMERSEMLARDRLKKDHNL